MIQFEHGKVLNILNGTTGEYEKFRRGDVVVEIGRPTKCRIVDFAYGYVHLVSMGEDKSIEEKWAAVPVHKFIEDWMMVEKGAGDWDDK